MKTKAALIIWSLASFIALVNLVIFDFSILSSQPFVRVQFTPDDAYYYLQLARNFAKLGYWTFDSGVSVASGFHPLLAYLLATIYKLSHPSSEQFVTITILLSSIPILLLVSLVWLKSVLARRTNFLVVLSLCVSAQSFLFNSVSGVEWSLVVILAALFCLLFIQSASSPDASLKLYIVGLCLSLARSDAGLLPLSVFVATILSRIIGHHEERDPLRNSVAGLLGTCSGFGLVLINNYLFSGSLIQSSAKMKLHWGEFQEYTLVKSVIVLMRVVGFDIYLFRFAAFFFASLISVFFLYFLFFMWMHRDCMFAFRKEPQKRLRINNQSLLYIASALCVSGYLVLYSRGGGGLQNWYTANFLVPMFMLFDGLLNFLTEQAPFKKGTVEAVFSLFFLSTIYLNVLSVYPIALKAPWPHQQVTLSATKYLNTHFDARIASWNAGVIGYYYEGTIINIDGLVNESIYAYAVSNRLPAYLKKENINYLIDFETMLAPVYRERGGYDNVEFLAKLVPITRFDNGQFPVWKHLTLYRLQD